MSIKIIVKSIWANPGNEGQRLKRSLFAVLWQVWKRVIRKPYVLTLANGRRFVAHPDCVVSSSLIYSQSPEFHELNFARKILGRGDVVVDVGANVGHIGMLLSDAVAPEDIIAFEPTPIAFQRLHENWSINNFPTRGLNQVAIGDQDGIAVFPDVTHPDTMNSQVLVASDNDLPTIEVLLRPLDSYRNWWSDRRLGLIKIDVEGHELAVFLGAAMTLKQDRPRLIMFESLNEEVDPQISHLLHSSNYHVFQLDQRGNPQLDVASAQNLFAVPRETLNEVIPA